MTSSKSNLKTPIPNVTSLAVSGFLALAFSACAFSENPGAGTPPPVKPGDVLDTLQDEKDKEASNGVLTNDNVSITFEENPMPGSYQMIIQWPTNIRHVTITVNSGLPLIVRNSDRASIAVEGGKPLNIQLVAYGSVSSSPLSSLELAATPPMDRVFDKEESLEGAETIRARRIFFRPKGRIVTNGYPLNIEAEKIYAKADGGVNSRGLVFAHTAHISTNIVGTKATKPSDLAGSVITISAKEGYGDLRIAMIGVDGRDGISGEEVEAAMVPRPSRARPVDPSLNGASGVEQQVGRPCRAGMSPDTGCGVTMGCTKHPTNGRDGGKGSRGIPGSAADNGGSYGKLFVSIEDSNQLRIRVGKLNGTPGKGKPGSPGFPGIQGGAAGAAPGICSAVAASNGANGPPGDQGATGDDGNEATGGEIDGGRTPVPQFDIEKDK